MQRVVLILAVTVLVTGSLGAGVLAAHWPFWQRAWQWHVAPTGWPSSMPGAVQVLHGGAGARVLDVHVDEGLAAAIPANTQALLRAHADGRVDAWFAPGQDIHSLVDGRDLSALVLTPLFLQLASEHQGLLDAPLGAWLPQWKEDRRGPITPRQLFWQISGLPARHFTPLNPFRARAQLASGPDFAYAALRWKPVWPPGSHFEASPVNAQLLALTAAAVAGTPFKSLLQEKLWTKVAVADAYAMLDHRGGDIAAHCCLRASLGDWLRLGLLLAADGRGDGARLWPAGSLGEKLAASPIHPGQGLGFDLLPRSGGQLLVATGTGRQLLIDPATATVLLWVGEGAPPPGLARLLP
ncbi:MAG: serine hydrolase [Pseudomonadota bacterium]